LGHANCKISMLSLADSHFLWQKLFLLFALHLGDFSKHKDTRSICQWNTNDHFVVVLLWFLSNILQIRGWCKINRTFEIYNLL